MKRRFLMMAGCLALVLTTACGNPKLKNGEEVVVSVDGKQITANELYNEIKKDYGYSAALNLIDMYIADKEIETTDAIKEEAQTYVDQLKQMAESYEMELKDVAAYYIGLSSNDEKEILNYAISSIKLSTAIENWIMENITDKEIEDYYNENYSEKISVRHILIKPEESDTDGKKALATAQDLIKQLKAVDKDKLEDKFIELAKEYSDDGTYENGGLYENFMKGEVVSEFWDASSALKDGEMTAEPVKTEYGYHVILRKSASAKPALNDSKEEIKTAIKNQKLDDTSSNIQYEAMIALREKYKIKFYDKDIESSYNEFKDSLKTEEK